MRSGLKTLAQVAATLVLLAFPAKNAAHNPHQRTTQSAAPASAAIPQFVDITASTGIKFEHLSSPEQKYIVESMSGGVALIDYDRDGWPDIYFTNARTVEMAVAGKKSSGALYHNNHDGTFTDVTAKAGVGTALLGHGRRRRRLQQRRLARPSRHLLRRRRSLSQQRRRHLHRRHQKAGLAERHDVGHRRRLRRLRWRRLRRSVRLTLRRLQPEGPAGVRLQLHLQVSRHRRAVRPARVERLARPALSQQRRRHIHRRLQSLRRRRLPEAYSASPPFGPTSTTPASPISVSPTTPGPTISTATMATATSRTSASSGRRRESKTASSRPTWASPSATINHTGRTSARHHPFQRRICCALPQRRQLELHRRLVRRRHRATHHCPTSAGATPSSISTTTAGWTSSWSTATSIRRSIRCPPAPRYREPTLL